MMSSSVRYAWARWGVALQSATRDCVAGRLRLTDAVARAVEEATSEKNKLTTVVRHVVRRHTSLGTLRSFSFPLFFSC